MEFSKRTKRTIVLLYCFTALPLMALLFLAFPSQPIDWLIFSFMFILALATTAIPFHIGATTIFLSQWVTVAAFLQYGAGVEMILVQFSILPMLFRVRFLTDLPYRILFNSWMFVLVSLVSALAAHAVGYQLGTTDIGMILIGASVFMFVSLTSNHIILYTRDRILGSKDKFFSRDALWDYTGSLITLPYAISLYVLQNEIGWIAFLLLGIPFLLVTYVVRMYNTVERANLALSKASAFGHEMADRLSVNQIVDMFMKRVAELFPLDAIYIVDNLKGRYVVLRAVVDKEEVTIEVDSESIQNSFIHSYFSRSEKQCFSKASEWREDAPDFLEKDMNSLLIVPIHRNKKTEGMVILSARKKYAFEKYQMDIVHLLSTYFAVSLEKAKYVHAAVEKSETCALTGLYNYRYLDKKLEIEQNRLDTNPHLYLSALMLDIDHFKQINDQYGHHAGNSVLKDFARLLKNHVPEDGTIARYGGEEFVILLPHMTKQDAAELGEKIRKEVQITPFLIDSDLSKNRQDEIIYLTVSIGVSNAPEDTDETITMLRNADRALYIGAKQAGRNRVAEYNSN
ncbi:diguanylate cyclase (GGDEF)-like protein [Chryseomicrobium aureum]|uniref:sensor domain-containing diguanylate cyclase n=1 Tax=Chryseomicrobium aureum TaxID=1441723 RepID=UPI001959D09C|nr:sensor domain-containing diguanylate cyclase [Chryseomicrobium aureum]MBM7706679.1 diguanylate cyclase (GGDEF)-like protein [Chryseomicrobium aureum]